MHHSNWRPLYVTHSQSRQQLQRPARGLTWVEAKYLHAGDGGGHADPEGEHIGQRGDGDGDSGLLVGVGHPARHRVPAPGPPPGREDHECVVHADTCRGREGGGAGVRRGPGHRDLYCTMAGLEMGPEPTLYGCWGERRQSKVYSD